MEHDVIEVIRYLNSADGPHMPLRAIAPYLGVPFNQLAGYLHGAVPREETRKRLEKGTRELIQEIMREGKWLL